MGVAGEGGPESRFLPGFRGLSACVLVMVSDRVVLCV